MEAGREEKQRSQVFVDVAGVFDGRWVASVDQVCACLSAALAG